MTGCTITHVKETETSTAEEEEKEGKRTRTTKGVSESTKEKETETNKTNYEVLYSEKLDRIREIVRESGETDASKLPEVEDEFLGIQEVSTYGNSDQIGYVIQGISEDGVPELIIGILRGGKNAKQNTQILNIFYVNEGEVKPLLDGWYRNAWYLPDTGELYNTASDGAANTVVATYWASSDADEIVCDAMYFTEMVDENGGEVGWYYNPYGEYAVDAEDTEKTSEDEFAKFMNDCEARKIKLDPLPIPEANNQ